MRVYAALSGGEPIAKAKTVIVQHVQLLSAAGTPSHSDLSMSYFECKFFGDTSLISNTSCLRHPTFTKVAEKLMLHKYEVLHCRMKTCSVQEN